MSHRSSLSDSFLYERPAVQQLLGSKTTPPEPNQVLALESTPITEKRVDETIERLADQIRHQEWPGEETWEGSERSLTWSEGSWKDPGESRVWPSLEIFHCPINPTTMVKIGRDITLKEAATIEYIRQNTTIPVPRVHKANIDDTTGYPFIVMDYVCGERLADVWKNLNDDQKNGVIKQMRDIVSQLRNLKGTFIGYVDGIVCEHGLFLNRPGGYGPYKDEDAFNEGLITFLQSQSDGWSDSTFGKMRAFKVYEIVMTHGALVPTNILVKDCRIVGILDWSCAGFYPDYWEYCEAHRNFNHPINETWCEDGVAKRILQRNYKCELDLLRGVGII